jgi:hypothetical protein
MSLGYFAVPLHLPGSDPARATEQDLDRLGFLDGRRFEEGLDRRALHSPLGEHPRSCPDLFMASALACMPSREETPQGDHPQPLADIVGRARLIAREGEHGGSQGA